jgi:transposase-like protein
MELNYSRNMLKNRLAKFQVIDQNMFNFPSEECEFRFNFPNKARFEIFRKEFPLFI